jgi:hypothetical protein
MNWNLQAELGKPSILHPDQGKFPFLLTVAQLRSLRLRLVICSCHWIKMKNNQQSDTSFFRCLMHGNMIMESISEFLDLFLMDIAHSFHAEVLRVNEDAVTLNTTKNLLTRKLTTRTSLK